MIKVLLNSILAAIILSATSVFAGSNAVEITIGGRGPAVDGAAFTTVQQVIGQAVANGVVDKFVVSGYGIEGGFSACAQASPRTQAFPAFLRQLHTITPNPKTTFYSLNKVAACAETTTFCTQDVQQCPDGSYVSRLPPSCEFVPCPN